MVLMQNCKMANATSNSTAVVLTENDFPRAALERRNPAKLRRSLSSLDLVVWTPLQVKFIIYYYEYSVFHWLGYVAPNLSFPNYVLSLKDS